MTYDRPNEVVLRILLERVAPTGTEELWVALNKITACVPYLEQDGKITVLATAMGDLTVFTHRELAPLASLPPDVKFRWMSFRDVCNFARANRMTLNLNPPYFGFSILTCAVDQLCEGLIPFSDAAALAKDELLSVGPLQGGLPEPYLDGVRAAAAATKLQEVRLGKLAYEWQGDLPCLFYSGYPHPIFEVHIANLWKEAGQDPMRLRTRPLDDLKVELPRISPLQEDLLSGPANLTRFPDDVIASADEYPGGFPEPLIEELKEWAEKLGLQKLVAIGFHYGKLPAQPALAYLSFPHDEFAAKYTELHRKHYMGWLNVPLISVNQVVSESLAKNGLVLYEDGQQSLF